MEREYWLKHFGIYNQINNYEWGQYFRLQRLYAHHYNLLHEADEIIDKSAFQNQNSPSLITTDKSPIIYG